MLTEISAEINETLRAALAYDAAGISTIPIQPGSKEPPVKWKPFQQARATRQTLVEWFGDGCYQIAVIPGAISGNLAIRDFDRRDAYQEWESHHQAIANSLPTVETAKGFHVWFRVSPDQMQFVRNATGKRGNGAISTGDGEFRASAGCYTVAPPSRHPNGPIYRWLRPLGDELPELDPFASGLLPEHLRRESNLVDSLDTEDTADTSLHSIHKVVSGAPLSDLVAAAIERTAPTEKHDRNSRLFRFCRELKSIPELTQAAPQSLEWCFKPWHERALPFMQVKSPCRDYYCHLAEFERAFENVKHLIGQEPIAAILETACSRDPPSCALQFDAESKLSMFISFLRELQRQAGRRPFFLDCRTAGVLFGVSHQTPLNWLELLRRRKIIRRVTMGKRTKASEYRYCGGD